MVPQEACPPGGSPWFKRNGHIHTGKQNHRCKQCGRAFILNPDHPVITEEQRTLIERFLPRNYNRKDKTQAGAYLDGTEWNPGPQV